MGVTIYINKKRYVAQTDTLSYTSIIDEKTLRTIDKTHKRNFNKQSRPSTLGDGTITDTCSGSVEIKISDGHTFEAWIPCQVWRTCAFSIILGRDTILSRNAQNIKWGPTFLSSTVYHFTKARPQTI